MNEGSRPSPADVAIVPCAPADYDAFRRVLEAPQAEILDKGGHILVALVEGEPAGVCALLRVDEGTFELAKMAVAEDSRGLGIGSRLGEAAIATARAAGASRLILESNTILAPAIALYRKLGFTEVTGIPSEYSRCNIHMEMRL